AHRLRPPELRRFAEDRDQAGASVFRIDVDRAALQGLETDLRPREAEAAFDFQIGAALQKLREDLAEEAALFEVLGADDDRRGGGRGGESGKGEEKKKKRHRPGPHPRPSPGSPRAPAGRGETRSTPSGGFCFSPLSRGQGGGSRERGGGEGLTHGEAPKAPAHTHPPAAPPAPPATRAEAAVLFS